MAQYQISTTQWLELDSETRTKIVQMFGLRPSEGSKVYGTRLLSDGFTNENLSAITVENINAVMGTSFVEEDILKAFHVFAEYIKNPNPKITNEEQEQPPQSDQGTALGSDEGKTADAGSNGQAEKNTGDNASDAPASTEVSDSAPVEGGQDVQPDTASDAGSSATAPIQNKRGRPRSNPVS